MADENPLEPRPPKPWERQPYDTDKSWQGFLIYLDLGPDRSYKTVAAKLGKHWQQIADWGSKKHWVSRVAAYENELLGVITPEERDEALGAYQVRVIADANQDYKTLRELWLQMLENLMGAEAPSPKELGSLISSRNQLDLMARRTARMPTAYRANEEDGLRVEQKQFYLDANSGPLEITDGRRQQVLGADDDE